MDVPRSAVDRQVNPNGLHVNFEETGSSQHFQRIMTRVARHEQKGQYPSLALNDH